MTIADILIGVDPHIDIKAREQLRKNIRRQTGVKQVCDCRIKPECQGILVSYDPDKTKLNHIFKVLEDFDDTKEWHSCYPGDHCALCELTLN